MLYLNSTTTDDIEGYFSLWVILNVQYIEWIASIPYDRLTGK